MFDPITNSDQSSSAYIARECHGNPEEVVSNLSALQALISRQEELPAIQNIAAQFLFLDCFNYVYQVSQSTLGEVVYHVMLDSDRIEEPVLRALQYHHVLAADSVVEDIPFIYQITVTGKTAADWLVKIAHIERAEIEVETAFRNPGWGFQADLEGALEQY